MAKDAYYFPHDYNARNDFKILLVRDKFGLEGYALFFMIIEVLREQGNYKFPLKYISTLPIQINVEKEKVEKFIDYCVEIDLLQKDDNCLYSHSLLNRMEIYEKRRDQARKAAHAKWGTEQQQNDSNGIANNKHEQCDSNAEAMQEHKNSNASMLSNKSMLSNQSNKINKPKLSDPIYQMLLEIDKDEAQNVYDLHLNDIKYNVWGRISVEKILKAWQNLQDSEWHQNKGLISIYWFFNCQGNCKGSLSKIKQLFALNNQKERDEKDYEEYKAMKKRIEARANK